MASKKEPKWDIGTASDKGNQAYELAVKYRADIEKRLKPGEIEELKDNLDELGLRRSGQSENLVDQKAKTQDQNKAIDELHTAVMDIRRIVKAATDESNILKAFGIGEEVSHNTVSGSIAAGNIIINGYNEHKEWANTEAGILEEDIQEIQSLIDSLSGADSTQEKTKFTKKTKTVDKNVLQRTIEDLTTKISAAGIKTYRKKDPSIVKLFEDLIP